MEAQALHVALDVGCRRHRAAIGNAQGQVLAEDIVVTVSSLMARDAALLGCRVALTSSEEMPTMPALVAAGMASFVQCQDLETSLPRLLAADHEAPQPEAIAADIARRIADRALGAIRGKS